MSIGANEEPSNERLIQASLAGDDGAFSMLAQRHRGKIFGIAARFARNDHELDDICQDIFVKAYQHLAKFRGDAPFEHWISRIAVRTCYDFLRKTRHDRENISLDACEGSVNLFAAKDDAAPEEAREILRFALAKLSAEERLVITLLELEEKSVREVAELTNWSEANVKVRAFRARNALKNILEAHHER